MQNIYEPQFNSHSYILKIDKTKTITSENLRLRIPSAADFPHIFSATKQKGFNDGMLWDPPTSMEELIEPLQKGIKAWEEGRGYGFTIEDINTAEFLGRISIRETENENVWNVGFWTHPRHQGKGIMTEALSLILHFGFKDLQATSIDACYAIWNKASEKVLTNNGMSFIKYIEKAFKKHGKWVDENMVAIGLGEWENMK